MNKRTVNLSLSIKLEIDGKIPADNEIINRLIVALNESMPTVAFDSEELGCMAWVNSWEYIHNC